LPPNQHDNNTDNIADHREKWATFTHTGKEVRYIIKIFKGTDIKIAFRTTNTLKNKSNNKNYKNKQVQQLRRLQA
jgi:hypothetical protein